MRLVFLFALVAVLPGALVYAVSVQFIGRSIESWFDVRVDRALEGGLNLGRNALDYLLNETDEQGDADGAVALADSPGNLAGALNRAAEQAQRVRGGAVLAVGQRARRRRHRRVARHAGAAAAGGAAPRAAAAALLEDRAGARRRPRAARRRAGEHARTASIR